MTSPIQTHPTVSQFAGVTYDQTRDFGTNGSYRVMVYAAYNAFGLIGPERNGIAVIQLEGSSGRVVADSIAQADSGYFGPSNEQVKLFEEIKDMSWETFRAFVNSAPEDRKRFEI
ncbi:hypothetical protein ACI2KR_27070 [Pseudomonas luteola]